MTNKEFARELNTLNEFFTLFCKNKHDNQNAISKTIIYKNQTFSFSINLCEDCAKLLDYSVSKLQNCPHEIKPKCRKCPNPCYEKDQWKKVAKIMRYSGVRVKIKKLLFNSQMGTQ